LITVNQAQYRKTGYVFPRDYDATSYVDIFDQEPVPFKYKDLKRSDYAVTQQLSGWLHTDESKTIETRSDYLFQRGDKVRIGSGEYEVVNVSINEDKDLEIGDYWNVTERNIQVLSLS